MQNHGGQVPRQVAVPWVQKSSGHGVVRGDPDWEDFLDLKFRMNEFFARHRQGLSIFDPSEAAGAPFFMNRFQFKRIMPPWENIYAADVPYNRPLMNRRPPGQAHNNAKQFSRRDIFKLHSNLWKAGCKFYILRVLAAGGNGVALLCELDGQGAGPNGDRKFVIKADLRGMPTLGPEKELMLKLKRAQHITQMLTFGELFPNVHYDMREFLDKDHTIQLLEFMKNGDMASMIDKMAHLNLSWRIFQGEFEQQIWKVFFCLVRACIDMQYPPRRMIDHQTGAAYYEPEIGELLPGGVPQVFEPSGFDLVHFDLDPLNILIGDYNKEGHQDMPVFKVTDFGLAKRTTDFFFNSPVNSQLIRKCGKTHYYLPEQHHKEWEFVDVLPQNQNPRPKVAGQYGPASNIFCIGNCMVEMLTGYHIPYPPRARGPVNSEEGTDDFPIDLRVRNAWDQDVRPFYTHGAWLVSLQIDTALRDILLRCLADQPADRPSLHELSYLMQKVENSMPPGAWDNGAKRRELEDLLFSKPPPPQPVVNPPSLSVPLKDARNRPDFGSAPAGGNIGRDIPPKGQQESSKGKNVENQPGASGHVPGDPEGGDLEGGDAEGEDPVQNAETSRNEEEEGYEGYERELPNPDPEFPLNSFEEIRLHPETHAVSEFSPGPTKEKESAITSSEMANVIQRLRDIQTKDDSSVPGNVMNLENQRQSGEEADEDEGEGMRMQVSRNVMGSNGDGDDEDDGKVPGERIINRLSTSSDVPSFSPSRHSTGLPKDNPSISRTRRGSPSRNYLKQSPPSSGALSPGRRLSRNYINNNSSNNSNNKNSSSSSEIPSPVRRRKGGSRQRLPHPVQATEEEEEEQEQEQGEAEEEGQVEASMSGIQAVEVVRLRQPPRRLHRLLNPIRKLGRFVGGIGGRIGKRHQRSVEGISAAGAAAAAAIAPSMSVIAGQQQQGQQQEEEEEEEGEEDDPNGGNILDCFAGVAQNPNRGVELFYVPLPGDRPVRQFRRAQWWEVAGAVRWTYFYDPEGPGGQKVLDAAISKVAPFRAGKV